MLQVTLLIKMFSRFCAFKKKFKLLNLCGFLCVAPISFYSHLLPSLICDRFFFLLSLRNKMWGSINLPVSSAIGQLHKTTSFCGPELFDNSKVGMSPLS